ncbi:MAG: AbrB/MazE/SpoVT family DNA-binding domain-containing protein [Patescibacteria group bacterium]|jgi:AbrB family looped-hinge helix DNA binding protein|nr:AbrB/MazE/SpoVT family DNA-binding domain-containing protein [Patescibacteria group bacterium]
MTTISKATTKGQITIPKKWRDKFNTNQFVITDKGDKLEIEPLIIDSKKEKEFTVFDAIRDNKGKGMKAKDLVDVLKRIS